MDAGVRLKQVGLFADLSDDDLEAVCGDVATLALAAGEVLFEEGEVGDRAYVVAAGQVEVVKAGEGRQVVLAVQGPGAVIGEMALLRSAPRNATVRARSDAELLAIPKDTLDQLLASSPTAARAMFRSLVDRMEDTAGQLRHAERMAQLGTLTAGVAHELNNPAAAVHRGTSRLADALDELIAITLEPPGDEGVARRRARERLSAASVAPLSALARSDAEEAVESRLEVLGVDDAWELASELVDARVDVELLEDLVAEGDAADTLRFVVALAEVESLVAEVGEAASRLSAIVQALKGYAYLDRAPVNDVDVAADLRNTLVLLAHKAQGIDVTTEFDDDLPTITALGGELNQVWTNLLDNAFDALEASDDPAVVVRAFRRGSDVVVEIEDNGPGIPVDAQKKVFDAFFTTKPPGKGTGLGLQTSYRIVVHEHEGELEFTSEPGRTVFRVVLPVAGPSGSHDAGATTSAAADDVEEPADEQS